MKKTLKKEKVNYLNETAFLLGIRAVDNDKIYLVKEKWDCDWYWGFGYLHVYNKRKTDINEHTHFDSIIFNHKQNAFVRLHEYFKEFVLEEKEIWILLDYMKSLYTLKDAMNYYYRGGSYYTATPYNSILKNEVKYNGLREEIAFLLDKVNSLLTPLE